VINSASGGLSQRREDFVDRINRINRIQIRGQRSEPQTRHRDGGQAHADPSTDSTGSPQAGSGQALTFTAENAEKWDTDQQEWEMPMVPLRLWRCFSLIAVEKKVTEELTESLDVA
jgi:hypothetical protein